MPSKREKGGAFEREVCVALSKAITHGTRKDLFWRTAMSGGRATRFNRNAHGERNLSQMGDICAIDAAGNWFTETYLIECKFHKDAELTAYLLHGKGRIRKWVGTMEEQGKFCDRRPLLVFKQNHVPALVLTRETHLVGQTDMLSLPRILTTRNHYYLYKFTDFLHILSQLTPTAPILPRRRPKDHDHGSAASSH